MAVKKKSEKRIKKENYWARLQEIVKKYKNVMFVDANNVSSRQISMIRLKLRPLGAILVMGKNVSGSSLSFQRYTRWIALLSALSSPAPLADYDYELKFNTRIDPHEGLYG